jgi:hypothetical protein
LIVLYVPTVPQEDQYDIVDVVVHPEFTQLCPDVHAGVHALAPLVPPLLVAGVVFIRMPLKAGVSVGVRFISTPSLLVVVLPLFCVAGCPM